MYLLMTPIKITNIRKIKKETKVLPEKKSSAIKDTNGNILKAAQNYTVVNIQSDRTGFSALMLEEI